MRMRFRSELKIVFYGLFMLVSGCSDKLQNEGKVVYTQVPVSEIEIHLNRIDAKYAPNMTIWIATMNEMLQDEENLTSGFVSARAPEISYDGKMMVFSAQKSAKDTWQIWIMNLATNDFTQVTDSRTNCTDPTWLPNGDIAFSKLVTDVNSLRYHAIFTIGVDGCCEQRITFQPHEDINSRVLHDGRLLIASKQVYPENKPFKYLAIRPDGTKAEVFHLASEDSQILGKAAEVTGKVFFNDTYNFNIVRFNRPLNSLKQVISKAQTKVISSARFDQQSLLVSVNKPNEKTFGLALIDLNNPSEELFYFNNSEYHITEAVVVKKRTVPRKLPSRVNEELNSGFVFSMNTNASDISANGKTAKVQVLGMNEIIGETAVDADGSFYLELMADKPVRFQTLSENGDILRGPSSWMWVRPNERRGCAGCHQNREITPNNLVPKALEKAPVAMIR